MHLPLERATKQKMKYRMYFYMLVMVVIALYSCYERRYFTNYKQSIYSGNEKIKIRTDGVYLAKKIEYYKSMILREYLIFYSDGICLLKGITYLKSWDKQKFDSIHKKNSAFYYSRNGFSDFGVYSIKDSILIIQNFEPMPSYRRGVVNTYFKIVNDTTILKYYYEYTFRETFLPGHEGIEQYIDKDIFGIGKLTVKLTHPIEYNFYKYDNTDSCQAWFYKKRWYKKNLHESRKNN